MLLPAEFINLKSTIEYNIGRYHVRINIWLLIVFLILQTLLNELGFWQLNRAKEKQQRLAQVEAGKLNSIKNLADVNNAHLLKFQQVDLGLTILRELPIFVDNKTHKKAPGYHVLQVAQDKQSGKAILINRGWVFADNQRVSLPVDKIEKFEFDKQIKITGRLYPISQEPITSLQGELEKLNSGYRIPYLDNNILAELKKNYQLDLEPYIVRIDSADDFALTVNWQWTNMPVEKHLAYAVQWFGLALALLIISLIVAVKRR